MEATEEENSSPVSVSLADLRLTSPSLSPASKRSFPSLDEFDLTAQTEMNGLEELNTMEEASFHKEQYLKPPKRAKLETEARMQLLELPQEIVCMILGFLTLHEIQIVRLCCKELRYLADKVVQLVVKITPSFKVNSFKNWLQRSLMEVRNEKKVSFFGILGS